MKYTADISTTGFSFLNKPITQSKKQREPDDEDIHRVFVDTYGIIREVGDGKRRVIPHIPKLRRF